MKTVCALLLFAVALPAAAGRVWTFEGRRYYDPLIAGVRDAHISALALASATRMDFMIENDSPRRVWDIDVGGELPIIGWEQTSTGERMAEGNFGYGTWLLVDFHMIEDFVDESAPIVNTDYRFGGMLKAQYGLPSNRWISARLLFGHESTHLGDEFSIRGQRKYRTTFERINVSWEYLDLGLLYESQPDSRVSSWSVRAGVTSTVPFHDAYYQIGPGSITESPQSVTLSRNWFDPYAGIEAGWSKAYRLFGKDWDTYASSEVRWRSRYEYHKLNPDASEERQASINLIVGTHVSGSGSLGRASPFVRFYRGINPHGQFRNQKNYTEYGIGVRLVR